MSLGSSTDESKGSSKQFAAYAVLLGEYDVEGQCLRRDLEEFIGKLVEHDLVELNSPAVAVQGTL